MLEDLANEVEAINSIYGEGTLQPTTEDSGNPFVLRIPNADISLKIQFPASYPDTPPEALGIHSSGEHKRNGDAGHILQLLRQAIGRRYRPGEVCLYDVIEDVTNLLCPNNPETIVDDASGQYLAAELEEQPESSKSSTAQDVPAWTISDVVIELKSVFVARCTSVKSPDQARQYLQHLLDTDKKVAKATHNITAHRIQAKNGVTFQDCDDDGEAAAGGRLLHLMQVMDLWDVMVVVTRWYGGQKLGPARFGIINTVARDSFVKAGFVQDHDSLKKKKRP